MFGKKKMPVMTAPEVKTDDKETKQKQQEANNILNNFKYFLDNYKLIQQRNKLFLKITLATLLVCVLSVGLNIFQFASRPLPVYFAVTPDMKLTKMVSLAQPYITDNTLKGWLVRAVNDTMAIDFRNYERVLLDAKKFFTKDAHTSLINSMQSSNIIKVVTERRLICTPIISKAPIVLEQGVLRGVYMWKLEMELDLSYEGSKGVELTQHLVAEIIVQRTSTLENEQGINIRQIVFREAVNR